MKSYAYFKRSLIIPAVIAVVLAVLAIVLISGGDGEGKLVDILISVGGIAFLYLAAVQVLWGTEPISSIFEFGFSKPGWSFGLIFELDLDGIIWFLTVKLILAVIAFVLSALLIISCVTLCAAIAPFSFPFALMYAIKNPDELEFL